MSTVIRLSATVKSNTTTVMLDGAYSTRVKSPSGCFNSAITNQKRSNKINQHKSILFAMKKMTVIVSKTKMSRMITSMEKNINTTTEILHMKKKNTKTMMV